ncbi:hypothetical protein Pedsa_0547 [Pseudopedobacter saltans DSM 12145]|uniref:NACHT domain-containing protein n=1 Tax=Pseudopedobacter saltans (strain ATCC 51119 / DSM 12145 / JCM 21818 / CCUG 39354 / LMG 10337 / NBRC 100064 / NCIMB 13643) TaxID=762903 RepID=F0S7A2_PSESL|nr:hypothetical protein [Pseudopedobacter saltans]ADY51127.1 hypothetical protein Pedsa_0547 [Pseudopedobacter saltans DSM 12145]
MDWELIKQNISKEIGATINTIDPAFDIDACLTLYYKILNFQISIPTKNDLNGLEQVITETIKEIYVDGLSKETSIGLFCKNFEQFIKKIYYILEEGEFIDEKNRLDPNKLQALTPFLDSLNKIRPIYIGEKNSEVYDIEIAKLKDGVPLFKVNKDTGLKMYKRLYPSSLNFDSYSDLNDKTLNDKYQSTFLLHLIKAVILKNEQSHQAPNRSRLENLGNLSSTLIAELWIINFLKKELSIIIKKDNYKKKDFDDYINTEINRVKKQNSKFVSLNLKQLSDKSSKINSGFIEDLLPLNRNRMRILGQGGSGKTTTLEFLVYRDSIKWKENPTSSKIPVIIALANLSATQTIIDSIAKKLNIGLEDVEELLETNELNLFLDGLNEIVENRESKKRKLQEIANIIEEYPDLSIILTDRFEFDSYQNNMFNIPTYIIQKLDKSQINEFVEKYCNYSSEQTTLVLEVINSKSRIHELLMRPLILTRAIEIIKIDNDLPEKEGQIIEKFIDILLRREKDEKKDPLLNINSFKLLLSFAANEIYHKHRTNASIHEFSFNKMLVEGAEKYGLEKFNAGYISRIGYELDILLKSDDLFQFYHQSYFEFFCSNYLKYEIR